MLKFLYGLNPKFVIDILLKNMEGILKTKFMFNFDKTYQTEKVSFICGIDEAGRGPLAGPVVCAGVIMPLEQSEIIEKVNDSKKLSEKTREELYDKIIEKAIDYSVVFIDEKTIDEINILNATKLGMKKVLQNLYLKPDLVLIDAVKLDTDFETVSIIKGDEKSYLIACASILAKVERDRYMQKLGEDIKEYGFEKHKGYGTKQHMEMLRKYGACSAHRKSFIKKIV